MLYRGEISAALRYINEREKGRVLVPGECEEKSGDEVSEMLRSQYPEGRNVESDKMPIFDGCKDMLDIEVSETCEEHVGKR